MECGKLHGRRRRHLDVVQHDPAVEPRHPTLGIQRPECTEVALAARVLADLVRVRVRVWVSPLTLTLTRAEAAGAVQVLRHGARMLPRRSLPLPAHPGLELPRVTSR